LRRAAACHGIGAVVEFAGPRTHRELPDEYAAADVVVVPSVIDSQGDSDGLPNVVLEAMASGRAVVASDVAAVSDAVEHEVTGLLVPPGDPSALAAALRRLQADPALRARLGKAARQRVVSRFDLTACAEAMCTTLDGIYG
jgi:glycosyltransferase involved in cell wall biosynthesis